MTGGRLTPVGYRTRRITFTALVPVYASDEEVADFVADSLQWVGGYRAPHDAFFNSLSVTAVRMEQEGVKTFRYAGKKLEDLYPEDLEEREP